VDHAVVVLVHAQVHDRNAIAARGQRSLAVDGRHERLGDPLSSQPKSY
jgi:hypothetical protein